MLRKCHDIMHQGITLCTCRYLCGVDYFEKSHRFFASNCSDCIVVHNNWIVGREAKVYRFKEHLLWMYDKDSYYPNTSQDYLMYANPIVWPTEKASQAEELEAMKAALALGEMLNRIVILPRFHCTPAALGIKPPGTAREVIAASRLKDLPRVECPLNGLLNITAFDAVFGDRSRESSFLRHPLVKDEVKVGLSTSSYLIIHSKNADIKKRLVLFGSADAGVRELAPSTSGDGLVESDIIRLFGNSTDKVLVFHSLYRTVPAFSSAETKEGFERRIKQAFHAGHYRQL